jgi:hypothetical protein
MPFASIVLFAIAAAVFYGPAAPVVVLPDIKEALKNHEK